MTVIDFWGWYIAPRALVQLMWSLNSTTSTANKKEGLFHHFFPHVAQAGLEFFYVAQAIL